MKMRSHPRNAGRFARLCAIGVLTTLALGCSPNQTVPAVTGLDPVPAIIWTDGIPDDGEFDSPWTQAFREYLVAYAAAFNSRTLATSQRLADLSGPQLRSTVAERDYRNECMPGPLPAVVTGLEESDNNTAIIDVCVHTIWSMEVDADWDSAMSVIWGRPQHWTVERDNGEYRVVGTVLEVEEDFGRSCSLDGVEYGLFDPNPLDN